MPEAVGEEATYKLLETREIYCVKSWVSWELDHRKTHWPASYFLLLQPGFQAVNRLFIHGSYVFEPIGRLFKQVVMRVMENNPKDHSSAGAVL